LVKKNIEVNPQHCWGADGTAIPSGRECRSLTLFKSHNRSSVGRFY